MNTPLKRGEDYIFKIMQEVRIYGLKAWEEERKEDYWRETAKRCWNAGKDRELISLFSSLEFKEEVGESHIFSNGLDIPFSEIDYHYRTMRAGAAHILRRMNPEIFQELPVKAEAT